MQIQGHDSDCTTSTGHLSLGSVATGIAMPRPAPCSSTDPDGYSFPSPLEPSRQAPGVISPTATSVCRFGPPPLTAVTTEDFKARKHAATHDTCPDALPFTILDALNEDKANFHFSFFQVLLGDMTTSLLSSLIRMSLLILAPWLVFCNYGTLPDAFEE